MLAWRPIVALRVAYLLAVLLVLNTSDGISVLDQLADLSLLKDLYTVGCVLSQIFKLDMSDGDLPQVYWIVQLTFSIKAYVIVIPGNC